MEDNRNAKKVSILLLDMTFMICILQLNVKARRTLRFEESLRQEDLDQANRALDGVDLDEWDQRKKLLVDLGGFVVGTRCSCLFVNTRRL